MPMEELPAEYANFFASGELPEGLRAEHDAADAARATAEAERLAAEKAAEVATAQVEVSPEAEQAQPVVKVTPVTDTAEYQTLLGEVQKLQQSVQQLTTPKVVEPVEPDPVEDPMGNLKFQFTKLSQQIEAIQNGQVQTQQMTEQQRLMQHITDQVKAFTTEHPDYGKAFVYLKDSRLADYKLLGYSDKEANEAVQNEHGEITKRAVIGNKNPASLVYDMAKKYGYKAEAVVAVKEEPAAKIARIKEGLKAAEPEAERAVTQGKLTVSNLREASNKELDEMVEKRWDEMFPANQKSIFG